MGAAIARSLLADNKAYELSLIDTNHDKLDKFQKQASIYQATTKLAKQAVKQSEIVIFAIKPQVFREVVGYYKDDFQQKSLLLSIAAGINLKTIQDIVGNEMTIVRAMPNLAASSKQSMTGWIANSRLTQEHRHLTVAILESFGDQLELEVEDQINKLTALSGSGPAYFFLLTELLQQQAQAYGFDSESALKIAKQILQGASSELLSNNLSPQTLKENVCSKGGTTEAALNYLLSNNWNEIFKEALDQAYTRAKELSGPSS